jgi:hypothetical protein
MSSLRQVELCETCNAPFDYTIFKVLSCYVLDLLIPAAAWQHSLALGNGALSDVVQSRRLRNFAALSDEI